MAENSAPVPHTAFPSVNQSARWNSQIIEKGLPRLPAVTLSIIGLSGGTPQLVDRDRVAEAADGGGPFRLETEFRRAGDGVAHRLRNHDRLAGEPAQARRQVHRLADDG